MKRKEFGLTETKLFHFHRIFKLGWGGGRGVGFDRTHRTPLDSPLYMFPLKVSAKHDVALHVWYVDICDGYELNS